MNEIINIFENSMSLTVTTVIAAIGVGLNVWFKKKATGDPKREELIKICSKIYLMKNIQIILIQNIQSIQKPIVKKGGNNLCDHIKSINWNLI